MMISDEILLAETWISGSQWHRYWLFSPGLRHFFCSTDTPKSVGVRTVYETEDEFWDDLAKDSEVLELKISDAGVEMLCSRDTKELTLPTPRDYHYEVMENGSTLASGPIADPFITTNVTCKGWRTAWKVLRGKERITVCVTGSPKTVNHVMGEQS